MIVLMFEPRFHDRVADGTKAQTIRGRRKRPVRAGDALSLRAWEGSPYRSPQRVLAEGPCLEVLPVVIERTMDPDRPLYVEVAGIIITDIDGFAYEDGFRDAADMAAYYDARRYPAACERDLIRWRPIDAR